MKDPLDYYDISPEISEEIAVWPGDTSFQRIPIVDFAKGGGYLLSTLHSTVHLGAHTDAPNHYHPQGQGISARSLNYYIGPCQVISLNKPRGSRITPLDIEGIPIQANRILFKTNSFPNPNGWVSDFSALSVPLIEYLSTKKVILVGIDTPSIDLFDDSALKAHHAVYRADMAILEGIVLTDVPDGLYILVALPLRIKDADASPVRAILLREGFQK